MKSDPLMERAIGVLGQPFIDMLAWMFPSPGNAAEDQRVRAEMEAIMDAPSESLELVTRLRKRADQAGDLLVDPPTPTPDKALLREAAKRIEELEMDVRLHKMLLTSP